MKSFFSVQPRSEENFYVRKCGLGEWSKFKRYHYLTSNAPKHAVWYGLYTQQNQIIGIAGVIHFPSVNKRLKKCSRLIILPDYQGIGLGVKFLEEIAKIYIKENYDFAITTSAKNLVSSLCKNNNWMLIRYGIKKPYHSNTKLFNGKLPRDCVTYTFFAKSHLKINKI